MLRELSQIITAIQLSLLPAHPVAPVRQEQLATVIQREADHIDVDPFTYVAIISHESQWNEKAISGDGEDYGLMQVRAKYYYDNHNFLLNGETNIRAGSAVIKKSVDFCRKMLKREPTEQEWLSVYQGARPSCKPTKLTQLFEDYEVCIRGAVVNGWTRDCREIYWGKLPKGR